MKRLSLYLFLILFTLPTPSQADDIRDFQIEGMSVGDSLLDHLTESKIKKLKKNFYPSSKKYYYIEYKQGYEVYDQVQFHIKTEDKNYIIYTLGGVILYKDNIRDCYDKKNKIVEELTELFKEAKIRDAGIKPHSTDKTGKSTIHNVFFDFKSGDAVKVACFDWSKKIEKEKNWSDNLRVSIGLEEAIKWFRNEAYK